MIATIAFKQFRNKQIRGVLNTVDRDGEFVNANSREIERAMRITRDDNKFKYMDISQQVPMSKQEVKKMLRGNGILENQADAFIEAQDKYQVNIIYLISHARVRLLMVTLNLPVVLKKVTIVITTFWCRCFR